MNTHEDDLRNDVLEGLFRRLPEDRAPDYLASRIMNQVHGMKPHAYNQAEMRKQLIVGYIALAVAMVSFLFIVLSKLPIHEEVGINTAVIQRVLNFMLGGIDVIRNIIAFIQSNLYVILGLIATGFIIFIEGVLRLGSRQLSK